jgi:hypothetical protein
MIETKVTRKKWKLSVRFLKQNKEFIQKPEPSDESSVDF